MPISLKTINTRFETIIVSIIIVLAFLVRFLGLGYSHFYGDEIKTLYLDKTVPASQFLLNQRKGPVQFMASWFMEKVTGGYDEMWIRLPFTFASTISVLIFYLVVKKLFGRKSALFSTLIYAFSGFSIAFGRTAQYQSFLMLFGLLSLYFMLLYREKCQLRFILLSAVSCVLALYSHYDAIFFLVPIFLFYTDGNISLKGIRPFVLYFVFVSVFLLLPFYLPYVLKGFFASNTVNYVGRRLSGNGYLQNNSLYTIDVYNPLYIFLILIIPGLFTLVNFKNIKVRTVQLWFIVSFIFYEFIISNPGTHIQNYILPIIILSGYALSKLPNKIIAVFIPIYIFYILIGFNVYTPQFNFGYPWESSKILGIPTNRSEGKYQLFLYGFPYNRGWDQISNYFKNLKGVRGVYTNDNDSLAEYYVKGIAYTKPGTNFLPQYYIYVVNSQELGNPKVIFLSQNIQNYSLEKEFFYNGKLVSQVYKLKTIPTFLGASLLLSN